MRREEIVFEIKRMLKASGIRKAYLFGSFARNEKRYNDIDIAIAPPKGASLLDLAHLENVLEDATGKKIDLGIIDSIHPLARKQFEAERVALI